MSNLMAHEKSFSAFRKHLHTRDPPCLPYFGVYLTDLTFIEEGNKDMIHGTDLINFSKRRRTAAVISEIQQYQQLRFNFVKTEEIQKFLLNLRIEEDEVCYQKSLEIEPRHGTRTVSFSFFLLFFLIFFKLLFSFFFFFYYFLIFFI